MQEAPFEAVSDMTGLATKTSPILHWIMSQNPGLIPHVVNSSVPSEWPFLAIQFNFFY